MTEQQTYLADKMQEIGINNLEELPRYAQCKAYSGLLSFSRIPRCQRGSMVLAGWANVAAYGAAAKKIALYRHKNNVRSEQETK